MLMLGMKTLEKYATLDSEATFKGVHLAVNTIDYTFLKWLKQNAGNEPINVSGIQMEFSPYSECGLISSFPLWTNAPEHISTEVIYMTFANDSQYRNERLSFKIPTTSFIEKNAIKLYPLNDSNTKFWVKDGGDVMICCAGLHDKWFLTAHQNFVSTLRPICVFEKPRKVGEVILLGGYSWTMIEPCVALCDDYILECKKTGIADAEGRMIAALKGVSNVIDPFSK